MKKVCKISGKEFEISDKEIALCKVMGVPLADLSPEEILRQLAANRNEWTLYKRKCDATGESIISAYPSDSQYKVYKNEFWWGDGWNALDYGREYDFNKPFFEQFAELQKVVPREGTSVFRSENCAYNGHVRESRNCYLNGLAYRNEDIYYSYWMTNNKDCIDCYLLKNSELCYWCIDSADCYSCTVLQEGMNCSDCHFSFQMRGCKNCLFCTNLVGKEYHIYNKSVSREEFEKKKKEVLSGSYKAFKAAIKEFEKIKLESIHRFTHCINMENSTADHAANLKNCDDCFEVFTSEDCIHALSAEDSRDVHNCFSAGWPGCDRIFTSAVTRGSTEIAYCSYTFFSSNLRYCDSSNELHDSFGCIGLQHKRNCILNKQYSKEEYNDLLPRIIEHMKSTGALPAGRQEWGQFFTPALSPYAYNESAAQDYLPLSENDARKLGYRWVEKDKKDYLQSSISEIPDDVHNLTSDFTKEILVCEECSKNYKVHPRELDFYKKQGLAIPRNCHICRHRTRFKTRNPLKLFERKCDKCKVQIKSSYNSKRPEKVYCEECYLAEVN
ncbi:MAG: hypothetical protein O3B47_03975 [bacterium]|nr:hypothetical protein [bacterium]